jgi:hypothetical protein
MIRARSPGLQRTGGVFGTLFLANFELAFNCGQRLGSVDALSGLAYLP